MLHFRALTLIAFLSSVCCAQQQSLSGDSLPVPQTSASVGAMQDSTSVVPVKQTQPVYPTWAERDQRQGQVILKVHISETGEVEGAEAVSGDPIFHSAAISALKNWKFQPFIRNGKPVKIAIEVPISFASASRITTYPDHTEPVDAGARSKSTHPLGPTLILPERLPASDELSGGAVFRKATPVYPAAAKHERIQGTILMRAVIRKDGLIAEMKVASGPKDLVQSATDAVSLWWFRPYMLKGKPVEVETTIQVNYTLKQ